VTKQKIRMRNETLMLVGLLPAADGVPIKKPINHVRQIIFRREWLSGCEVPPCWEE